MWLPDDRWTTALAYVLGAADRDPDLPLAGFQGWACNRLGQPGTSAVWFSVLFEAVGGEPGVWPRGYDSDHELNESVREYMYDLVLEYLMRTESPESMGPPTGEM